MFNLFNNSDQRFCCLFERHQFFILKATNRRQSSKWLSAYVRKTTSLCRFMPHKSTDEQIEGLLIRLFLCKMSLNNVHQFKGNLNGQWSEAITPMTDWELSESTVNVTNRSSSFTLISSNRILFQTFQFHWFNHWQTKLAVKLRTPPCDVSWATRTGLCKSPDDLYTKQSLYLSGGVGYWSTALEPELRTEQCHRLVLDWTLTPVGRPGSTLKTYG